MKKHLLFLYGLFLFVMTVSGCATYKTQPLRGPIWEDTSAILRNVPGKAQNLTLQQIRDAVISSSEKIRTFRANVEMTLTSPEIKGPIRCTGVLAYQSPKRLRVVGSKFTATVFDICSDGEKFQVYVPSEEKVYVGNCNNFHKVESLGINVFPADMASLFNYKEMLEGKKLSLETWPAYWLVHVLSADAEHSSIKGNLSVDRMNAEVFRCETFNPDGSVRFQAVFSDYAACQDRRFPQKIDIRWPLYDSALSITFSRMMVNGALDPRVFSLTLPGSAEAVTTD